MEYLGLMLILLLIIMMSGYPIGLAMLVLGMGFVYFISGDSRLIVSGLHRSLESMNSFPLMAIPGFVFVGLMFNKGQIGKRLFDLCRCIVGHFPGGLAHVNVALSLVFAGMSGSAVADAAGLGAIEVKAMIDDGYDLDFSCATTAASSTIGPIFPPSIPFVVYAWLTGVSTGALFLAGVLPALAMTIVMMIVVAILSKMRGYPRRRRATLRELLKSIVDSLTALAIPVIILGGIVSGLFTPTEASFIAAIYTVLVMVYFHKEASWKDVLDVVYESVAVTSKTLFCIATAAFLSWVVIFFHWSNELREATVAITRDPVYVMVLIVILVLILGCFIEGLAMMMMLVPAFLPLLLELNINLLQFGVVFTLAVMIGMITPPLGLSLYAIGAVTGRNIMDISKACWPFMISLLVPLYLVIFYPKITLIVPELLGMIK